MLYQYVNPSGQTYTYGYNENLRLESVTTPRGIEGVRNVYDGANRVVSQRMPDGSTAELRYDDEGQCTYAKDQNGYITAYESDSRFRNIRTVYKDGEERFAYNDNDQLTMYTDKMAIRRSTGMTTGGSCSDPPTRSVYRGSLHTMGKESC